MPRTRRPLIALVALVAALLVGYGVRAATDHGGSGRSSSPNPSATGSAATSSTATSAAGVPLSSLPGQVADTVRLIRSGGPFPYPRNDGVVFHNNEHRLPAEPDGFYHEYTVITPGSPDRGARRIITGRDGRYWYTPDHYETFEQVDVTR